MLLQLLQQQQERMTALERELERLREERAGSKEHALALSVSALVGDDSEDSSAQSSRMVSSRPRRHYTASVIDQLYRDLSHRMGVEAGDHKGSLSHSCMTLDATSCFSDLGILIPRHDDDDDDEVAEEERVGAALPRSSSDAYVAVSSAGHQHTAGEATSGLAVSEHKTTTRRTHFSRGGGGAKEGQNGSSHHRHRRRRRHRDPEGQQASTSPTSLLSSLRTSTMYDVMAVTAPPQRGAAPHATTTMEESSSTVVDLTTII